MSLTLMEAIVPRLAFNLRHRWSPAVTGVNRSTTVVVQSGPWLSTVGLHSAPEATGSHRCLSSERSPGVRVAWTVVMLPCLWTTPALVLWADCENPWQRRLRTSCRVQGRRVGLTQAGVLCSISVASQEKSKV